MKAQSLQLEPPSALQPAFSPASEPMELLLYWRSVWKRKWWILVFAVLLAAIAAVGVSFMTPIYRATVTLLIEQNKAKLVSIEEVYSGVSPNREHYQTQAEVLKSPALGMKVIDKLGLMTHPEFDPRQRKESSWQAAVGGGSDRTVASERSEERLRALVLTEFLKRITIEPVRLTQLVKVSFDAADPSLAARIADSIADTYIEADVEVRARIRQRGTDWLADQLSGLKQNLEASERALQQYREREGLPDTKGLAQSGAVRQIEDLSRALNEATERRIEAEAAQRQIKQAGSNLASMPVVLRNTGVDRLKEIEGQAQKKVAELSGRYGPEHPMLAEAQSELKRARENTRRAIADVAASFSKEYQVAAENERSVQKALATAKAGIQYMNRKEFQLDALEQDLNTNRQIYEKFMNRYRETRATSDTQSSLVARVVDSAVPPEMPYKPRKEQIVAFGFMFGIIMASIIALMVERLNTTVKSSEEVEDKLGVPVLAVLPRLTGEAESSAGRHYLDVPGSAFSESIRSARTSILLSAIDQSSKTLLVTSSVPNEGKSAFAINLALAHAQTKKTLLIEADLRRPSVARHLGLDPTRPGLTNLFSGEANFLDCLQQVEGSSLYILPSGPIPENALEILSSERFRQMVARVSAACEIVVIDSPPVHLVSDAVVLSTLATGTVFVVRADSTPFPVARRCIRALQESGGNVLGIALNQLDFKKADRYYGAYTGYAREYGGYHGKTA